MRRYNRLMTIKKYANSATRSYMQVREVHYLCRVPGNNASLLAPLLKTGKMLGLKIARIITANGRNSMDDFSCERGDLLVEQVGLLHSDRTALIEAANALDADIQVIAVSSEQITVSCLHLSKHVTLNNCLD